jgi:hypothetical protein
MGEYALDQTGNEIKIGTCSNMYYLRYGDRLSVRPKDNNVNPSEELNLYWRLPFPDEDSIQPGYYGDAFRCVQLPYAFEEKHMKDSIKQPGLIQLHNSDMGIHVNLTCYHNQKLPEASEDCKPFFNGKSPAFSLMSIKNTKDGIVFRVDCNGCRNSWLCDFEEIEPYIYDQELKARLKAYTVIPQKAEPKKETKENPQQRKSNSVLSWDF